MTVSINDIKSADWQPKLGEIGSVVESIEDINQCIRIILATPKGSDPHRPEFGSDIWKYVDYPVKEAIPNIIRESVDAINAWEQRINISKVKAEIVESTIALQIEWMFKDSEETQSVEVTV